MLVSYNKIISRNIILILMFLFLTFSIKGQEKSPEQIKTQLKELRSDPKFNVKDTTNIILLNELCLSIRFENLDTVLILGKEALKLSRLAKYKRGEATSLTSISYFYVYSGNAETAIKYADSTLKIAIPNNFYKQSIEAYNILGISYTQLADYPNSYKYYLQGADLAKNYTNKKYLIRINANIGNIYSFIQDNETSLMYYNKTLLIANEEHEELLKWKIINNIAYSQSKMGNYDIALKNINKSIDYFKKTRFKELLAISYTTKAQIYLAQKEYEKAHVYYKKAIFFYDSLYDYEGEANVTYGLAASHLGLNEIDKAEELAMRSLEMYQKIKLKTGIQKSYITLYQANQAKNNFKKALHYLKLVREISDSMTNEFYKANLKMSRIKLDFKKEKELLQEQSEAKIAKQISITRWVLIALFISLLLAYKINSINKREKLLNKELSENKALLESRELKLLEINATQEKLFSIVGHDLKGPISSLHELLKAMTNEEDKEILIKSLLPKLNNYTNHVHFTLDNLFNWGKTKIKGDTINPSILNIHAIASGVISLYSEAILKKELTVKLEIDKETKAWADEGDINVVFRNLLSNAIKFTHSNGLIKLSSKSNDRYTIVDFMDNGVGMSIKTQELVSNNTHYSTFGTNNEEGTGLGLMLCKEIIARNKGEILIESGDNKGTLFRVFLPKSNTL